MKYLVSEVAILKNHPYTFRKEDNVNESFDGLMYTNVIAYKAKVNEFPLYSD